MSNPALSYVISTRNKLPYLKLVLGRLMQEVADDEEIIVVDGASTDGTGAWLKELKDRGKVHTVISGPDFCQAHGTNRGVLAARGELIKILTDDDAVHYPGIRECKQYMLDNPGVGLLVGNIADVFPWAPRVVDPRVDEERAFLDWMEGKRWHVCFGDQSLFYRRDALPLVGLWHTGSAAIDMELSVRVTSLRQVSCVWYTGYTACSIWNPGSLSVLPEYRVRHARDVGRIMQMYAPAHRDPPAHRQTLWQRVRSDLRRRLRKLRRAVHGKRSPARLGRYDLRDHNEPPVPHAESFDMCERWMAERWDRMPSRFLGPYPRVPDGIGTGAAAGAAAGAPG